MASSPSFYSRGSGQSSSRRDRVSTSADSIQNPDVVADQEYQDSLGASHGIGNRNGTDPSQGMVSAYESRFTDSQSDFDSYTSGYSSLGSPSFSSGIDYIESNSFDVADGLVDTRYQDAALLQDYDSSNPRVKRALDFRKHCSASVRNLYQNAVDNIFYSFE